MSIRKSLIRVSQQITFIIIRTETYLSNVHCKEFLSLATNCFEVRRRLLILFETHLILFVFDVLFHESSIYSFRGQLRDAVSQSNRVHLCPQTDELQYRDAVCFVFEEAETFRVLFGVTGMRWRVVARVVPFGHIFFHVGVHVISTNIVRKRIGIREQKTCVYLGFTYSN